jgi:putative Mg2+ transporter-C (MgtC) family protein
MDIFHTLGWQEILLRLGSAVFTGAVLGLNRELRGKPAGLRTNALVSLGSALLILAGIGVASGSDKMHQADVMSRAMQGIITGIGFLGAGVILRDTNGSQVHGITTAATIWLTATLGVLCGAGMWPMALLGMALTLVILIFGTSLERFLHRKFPKLSEHNRDGGPPQS